VAIREARTAKALNAAILDITRVEREPSIMFDPQIKILADNGCDSLEGGQFCPQPAFSRLAAPG
jgi:hypothetical protein